MGWKKLTVIVVAAAALVGGALSLSMYLTRQQEVEMEVADQKPQPPQAGDTTTLADMENMPIYYDDDEVLLLPVRNVVEGLGGSVAVGLRSSTCCCLSQYGAYQQGEGSQHGSWHYGPQHVFLWHTRISWIFVRLNRKV